MKGKKGCSDKTKDNPTNQLWWLTEQFHIEVLQPCGVLAQKHISRTQWDMFSLVYALYSCYIIFLYSYLSNDDSDLMLLIPMCQLQPRLKWAFEGFCLLSDASEKILGCTLEMQGCIFLRLNTIKKKNSPFLLNMKNMMKPPSANISSCVRKLVVFRSKLALWWIPC